MAEKAYLTREGYEKLCKELGHLKTKSRREVAKEIQTAREQGDLSENAEYDAAKEKQARIEKRIHDLETMLSRATIMEEHTVATDEIRIGSRVVLKKLDDKVEITYTLVDSAEADFASGKISVQSPVAQALLGHKTGDNVEMRLPVGNLKYTVISVGR